MLIQRTTEVVDTNVNTDGKKLFNGLRNIEVFITTSNREDSPHALPQSLIPCEIDFSSVTIISSDNCGIDKLQKERIVYKRNESNIDFFGSLDVMLELISKEFLLLYEHDMAMSGALTKQVNFLKNNPHVALVVTDICMFDEKGI